MFTGLIQTIGRIENVEANDSGKSFLFYCPELVSEIKIDDSIAVNGVCLTATAVTKNGFKAQAVHITLEKSNLSFLKIDEKVNIELSMKYSDRVGGHLVQGHVNDVATVVSTEKKGENYEMWLKAPTHLTQFLLKEGSVALDGISLTIADVRDEHFLITFIPHTWTHTQIHTRETGALVNIEVDMQARMIAQYVEHFMKNMKFQNAGTKNEF
ncbi:MAG: riboflavin synthase [Bacteriovoracaceae bacterium]